MAYSRDAIVVKKLLMPSEDKIWGLRLLLLDLISEIRPVAQSDVDALSAVDWALLMHMVIQHRLKPLLHWQLVHHRQNLRLPDSFRRAIAQGYEQATLRSLLVQRELVLTHRLLEQAGIRHMALKGAYLAWRVYPHPALRPLRDLDILVSRENALQAYDALLNGGLARINKYGYEGDPAAVMALSRHLPPLRSASGQLNIELHTRVLHIPEGCPDHVDLSDVPRFWDQALLVKVAGEAMLFESSTDLLLHLIVHAVYDHEFNNGPLLLSDLAFLLRTHQINWKLFWSLADTWGYSSGCALALALTAHYWGDFQLDWCGHEDLKPQTLAVLEDAAVLMLRNFDGRGGVTMYVNMEQLGSWSKRIHHIFKRLFVSKQQISALFGLSHNDWRIYFYYPVRWAKVLSMKINEFFVTNANDDSILDIQLLKRLRKHLSL